MNDLIRHAREFSSAFRQHQFEAVGDGSILFPAQHVYVQGLYSHRVNGGEWTHDKNLVPDEGINYLLDQLLGGGAAAPCYLSLYSNAATPAANWTAANYHGTANELNGAPTGYTETTRPVWTTVAAAAKAKDNYASPAAFTMVAATVVLVNGAGLHTSSVKQGTGGKLVSATRFATERSFATTDVFDLKYQLAITSS